MNQPLLISLVLCTVILCCGCTRESKWDPLRMDEGAQERPFTTTESGLKWRLLRDAWGSKPTQTSDFWVHYTGWLIDENGKEHVFDTTYSFGFATMMSFDSVIPGFGEGVQLCPEGGMIELEIPPDLGYGAKGMMPMIPPNTKLHFRIEMVEVH
ncbi:MAG: FKBP-type peptidyl-prolyl cis-trans isomerase [Planctomycetota bacterium]|nr:FKBP-type peptidyl-prolyl cis-trans isomerase [Planctomycetota bacterium]